MKNFLFFLLFPLALFSASDEELFEQRIYNHLQIKDYRTACQEAEHALSRFPHAEPLWAAYLKSLARVPDERELVRVLPLYLTSYPEAIENRELLEAVSWGLIESGENSSSPIVRLSALIAAAFAQDPRGVQVVQRRLSDSNSLLRAVAVQLAAMLPDESLKQELLSLFQRERIWIVRLEVLKAVGRMKIVEAKPALMALLSNSRTRLEEKEAAIQSLVALLDTIPRKEIETMASSNRAGLRLLACEAVIAFHLERDLDLMLGLLTDAQKEVRAAAAQAVGMLRINTFREYSIRDYLQPLLKDRHPLVAASAAWAITLGAPKEGRELFRSLMQTGARKERILIASALAQTGKYGLPYLQEAFQSEEDPLVRTNLALGLVGLQEERKQPCAVIFAQLKDRQRLMWRSQGLFSTLEVSDVRHTPLVPQYPEVEDLRVRLELLNVLAVLEYPPTQKLVRELLLERAWGVSAAASALLLQEGDGASIELIEALLSDPDPEIQVQAALILALWGKGELTVAVLEKAYPHANRELKERILEGLAQVHMESSIPFLVDCLQEPYQTLRLLSAAALLQCLSH